MRFALIVILIAQVWQQVGPPMARTQRAWMSMLDRSDPRRSNRNKNSSLPSLISEVSPSVCCSHLQSVLVDATMTSIDDFYKQARQK